MIRMKAVERFLRTYSIDDYCAGCVNDYLVRALGTGQSCLRADGFVFCKIKAALRISGDKFHMSTPRICKKCLRKSTSNGPARADNQRPVLARGKKRETLNHEAFFA